MRLLATFVMIFAVAGVARADWASYGGDEGGQRFVDSAEISPGNIGELVRAWTYSTGHLVKGEAVRRRLKFQVTPIHAGGKLFICTPLNDIVALDPGTGAEIWTFDAGLSLDIKPANDFNCRGVTYWENPAATQGEACAARIFSGTNDHRLIALDAATGEPCQDFGAAGTIKIDPEMALVWPGEFQITSPPVVAAGTVIVGSAISDNVRRDAPRGTVRAFDAVTGAPRWGFDPIPREADDPSAATWTAGAPTEGHSNVWAPMAVDAGRGLVFLPTSSPSPDFFGGARPGDNAHANSVVALEAATGRLRWAFQTVHHDVWDYDVPAQPMLATLEIGGIARDVVIQVTKTGLVFTLDRNTGEPVHPVEERPVPQGGAEGEVLSPTQPFPVRPAPLVPSTITPDEAYGFTPWDRGACRAAIASARAEGLYTPPSPQGTIVFPFTGGGANWGGGAFDPGTQTLFINTTSMLHVIRLLPGEDYDRLKDEMAGEIAPMRGTPYAMTRETLLSPIGMPCNPPPWGRLHAIDMETGEVRWEKRLGTTEELAPFGLALATGTPNLGGPLVTASGLVFIAAAADSYLRAFRADDGQEIWSAKLPSGGQATPMSYTHDGRQYVVIAAGGHSDLPVAKSDVIVAFALPRAGEPGADFVTRFYDRPGRRFLLFALGFAAVLAAVTGGAFFAVSWLRRSR